MIRVCCAALWIATVSGCAGVAPIGSGGIAPIDARDEYVVIGMHADISGVAATRSTVYAATPDALLIHDVARSAWLPPLTRMRGYPGGPASIVAADPVEDGVWVAAFGSVLYYRPAVDIVSSTLLPGVADAIFFDRRNPVAGAYVRSGGSWALISRTGASLPVAAGELPPAAVRDVPPALADVYREYPALRSFAPLLTRDARLRSWPVSAATRAPDRDLVWLGTRGNGLFRVDPVFQQADHLPYGLLEQGVASLAPAGGGVWIGGLGTSPAGRGGVSYASHDLQQWQWFEGPAGRPLGRTRVNTVSSHQSALWLGTDRGVFRLDMTNTEEMRQWTLGDGLPSDEVLAVLPVLTGTWVGTRRGLAFIPASYATAERRDQVRDTGVDAGVRALLLAGDRLWVGSDAGLLSLDASDASAAVSRAPADGEEGRLRRSIVALAASDSIIVVATRDELHLLHARTGALLREGIAGADAISLRNITALAADTETIWVGTTAGVTMIMRGTGAARTLRAGRELPAEVTSLAISPGVAWIGTQRGAVRVARYPDGGIR